MKMRLPNAFAVFAFFVMLLAFAFGGAPVFSDPDTAWHLAAGDLIRSQGFLPLKDPFAFTASRERWYNLSWGADILMSWLFGKGGFAALYIMTLAGFAAALALMIRHSLKRGAEPLALVITGMIAAMVMYPGVLARPHLFSVLLSVAFYLILRRSKKERHPYLLFALPPLMMLWVNLHGGFLFGFLVLGIFALESLIRRNRPEFRVYLLLIATCLVATLLNPYGMKIYYGAWRTLAGSFDNQYILEWKPVAIGTHLPMTLWLLVVLISANFRDARIALSDRLLALLMTFMALSSVRYAPVAVLLSLPYLSLRLTAIMHYPRIEIMNDHIRRDMRTKDIRIFACILMLAALALLISPLRDSLLPTPISWPTKAYPEKEAAYIAEHYPNGRFLNDYNIGGYLAYLWHGQPKVFVDGRASSLYSEMLLDDYAKFMEANGFGDRARVTANYYKIDGLIIPNEPQGANNWRGNLEWKPVFVGPVATVYVKKK